jgi:hypothetical protein
MFMGGCASGVQVGEEGRLRAGTEPIVTVAVTRADFDELGKAAAAKDNIGFFNVVLAGRAFPVDRNTRVLVIDMDPNVRRVRILEGPELGRSGWVPMEFVVAK